MSGNVAVVGATGRMGRAIMLATHQASGMALCAAVARAGSTAIGQDSLALAGITGEHGVVVTADLEHAASQADVVIDFSTADNALPVIQACINARTALVLGTTGLAAQAEAALEDAAGVLPVLVAANTSIGVAVLRHLAAEATRLLGGTYDIEIVEMHHRHKVDAPSGTATMLAEAIADVRELDPKAAAVCGREGRVGPRSADEIGVMTLRGGEVIGDHTVHFAGAADRIELTHRALDRSLFARGAVHAAKWLVESRPNAGRYGMADVLGLKTP